MAIPFLLQATGGVNTTPHRTHFTHANIFSRLAQAEQAPARFVFFGVFPTWSVVILVCHVPTRSLCCLTCRFFPLPQLYIHSHTFFCAQRAHCVLRTLLMRGTYTHGSSVCKKVNLKATDEAVSMQFGRACTAAGREHGAKDVYA